MNFRIIIFVLGLSVSIGACQKAEQANANFNPVTTLEAPAETAADATLKSGSNPSPEGETFQQPRKIIKNASLSIQVADLKKNNAHVKKLLEQFKATIETEQFFQHPYRTEHQWTLRVQPDQLEPLVDALEGMGIRVETRNIRTQDLTRGYLDVETRMQTKTEVLHQYQALLKKANKIEEILQIQEHLRIITEEIEASKAQLKSWDNEVQLATIHLVLFQEHNAPVADQRGFISQAFGRIIEGWSSLESLVLAMIGWWPFFAVGGLMFYLWRRFKR